MSKRIPQSFIDELLVKTDLIGVIERVVPLKKAGSNYVGLCPFHNEKSPSFTVSPSKQFYHCFGCGAHGNAISFIMAYEHQHFLDAIESLASRAGMTIPTDTQSSVNQETHQPLYTLLEQAEQFYTAQLQHPQRGETARLYLKNRGLSDATIKHFGIGFAPDGWDHLMRHFIAQKQSAVMLTKAGLLTENEQGKHYDRFRKRVMFPIRDRRGRVIGFGGRVLDDSTPKYLNSPETLVFHKGHELYGLYEARQANHDLKILIVVEGYMDVIALAEQGIHNAVATLGTAITPYHLQKLLRTCPQIVFCFDGDLAGQKAAWKALETALPLITDHSSLQFMFMPTEHDPDSFVRQFGQAVFLKALKEASTLPDFFLAHLSENVNLETLSGRAQLVATAMPYLQKMTAEITRELMIEALAKFTHTDILQLRHWSQSTTSLPVIQKKTTTRSVRQTPVRLAIALLLQHPHIGPMLNEDLPESGLAGLGLLKELVLQIKTQSITHTGALLEYWRDRKEIDYLAQLSVLETLIPESGVVSEVNAIFKHIKYQAIEERVDLLMNKATRGDLSNEEKQTLQKLLSYKKTGL